MSDDMKLIMEAWRKAVNEQFAAQAMMAQGQAAADIAQSAKEAIKTAPGTVYQGWKKKRGEWSEEGGWWLALRWAIDLLDPTGITDWPDVEDAWNRYMEWYNLQDSDPNKYQLDPELGNRLFVNFVFSVILAIPGVDLFSELSKRIGLKLAQGFFKSLLQELGAYLLIYIAISDIPSKVGMPSGTQIHRLSLEAQKWYDDVSDIVKHGEKKIRLPLGGQKGSSKKYDTFDKKKTAEVPEYYPPIKED